MKKFIALLSCLAILFCLTSCDAIIDRFKTEEFYYDFEEISQNVEKAEIIQLPHSDVFLGEIDNLEESKIAIIRKAFYNCGLSIKEVKYEPLAAVEGYSLEHAIQENDGILVFDFGGGTIDVAYVQKRFSTLKVVCEPRGSSTCGGQDLDYLIYKDLRKKVLKQYSFDISQAGFVDYSILNNCRRLKEYFSGPNDFYETQVALVVNGQFVHYKYGLNRDSFNNIIGGKVQEAINIAKQVIDDVHSHKQVINKILLIGGSSQLTLIKEQLTTLLPNACVETCGEKDIAVALGNIANMIVEHSAKDNVEEKISESLPVNKEKHSSSRVNYIHNDDGVMKFDW